MRPPILMLSCLSLGRVCFYGQAADALSFEVASMKPASPAASGIVCRGGPGTTSRGIWSCSNVPLAFLISQAYGFQAYQFPPMAACCRDRVEVTAKMPPGTTKEQFHQMLQTLLLERMKLKLHHEQKEMAIYELSVAPKGLRMKESVADTSATTQDPWTPAEARMGKDGYPEFPAGRGGLAGLSGQYRWTGFHVSMEEMAKTLSFHLGGPVVDATGLSGTYDFDMTWSIDLARLMEEAGRRDLMEELPNDGPRGPSLMRAVQDQLGLKLSTKKGLGDVVVVDHVEKVPVEN